jgi:hypothetical protein
MNSLYPIENKRFEGIGQAPGRIGISRIFGGFR